MPLSPSADADELRLLGELNAQAFDLRHADARQALRIARQAHALALRLGDDVGLSVALRRVAVCRIIVGESADDVGDTPGIASQLQQALVLLERLGDVPGQAEVHKLVGHLRAEGRSHASALASFEHSLRLSQSAGDSRGEFNACQNLSMVHRALGHGPEALAMAFRCLALAEARAQPGELAYAHSALGLNLSDAAELGLAQQHLEQALALVSDTSDRALESSLRFNLGRLFTDAGQPEQALRQLRNAYELAQRTGNVGDQCLALMGLGLVQLALGTPTVGQPLLADALALAEQKADSQLMAQVLLAQAQVLQVLAQPQTALPLLEQALRQAALAQATPLVAAAHQRLSEVHEQLGAWGPALHHHQAFHAAYRARHDAAAQRGLREVLMRQAVAQAERVAQVAQQRTAELQQQTAALHQLAHEDGLTGVANRRWLDHQLKREVERARRFGHALSVAMVDIDHFKSVNDQCSHAVGDAVLRRVAELLRGGLRATDLVGRFGGEEFVLLLAETGLAQARPLADKLRQQLALQPWGLLHPGLEAGITVSIGLAELQPQDADAAAWLARADQQLYCAKRSGRNRVCA